MGLDRSHERSESFQLHGPVADHVFQDLTMSDRALSQRESDPRS